MSISSELTKLNTNMQNAYTAVNNKGGTLPASQNMDNLATAIGSIPSGSTPTLITKTITQNGTYNASSDNADGYSSVTVNVSGGSGYTELPSYQVSNGVASHRSKVLDGSEFSNITSIDSNGLYYSFYGCTGLTGNLSFPSLTSIGGNGLYYSFYGCTGLTSVSFPSLTSIGISGFYNTFKSCTGLTSVSFPSLTSIGASGGDSSFSRCTNLSTVDLSSLTTVGPTGMSKSFEYCSGLKSISFPDLTSIDSSGFNYTFRSCTALTDVYFNSLTTTSFGSYTNQFSNMLSSTGSSKTHTLHFPSNLQSTISGLTGYPTFGGTSGKVVLSFDLPATS